MLSIIVLNLEPEQVVVALIIRLPSSQQLRKEESGQCTGRQPWEVHQIGEAAKGSGAGNARRSFRWCYLWGRGYWRAHPLAQVSQTQLSDSMATGMGQYCQDLLDHRLGNDHERHGDENRFQFYWPMPTLCLGFLWISEFPCFGAFFAPLFICLCVSVCLETLEFHQK